MANVMITGGSGLLGWPTAEELLKQGHEVTIFDLVINQENIAPFADKLNIVTGDVNDFHLILATMKRFRIDHVIHLAAAIGHLSKANPSKAFETNIGGTGNIFDAAMALDVKRVVWSSSGGVLQADADYDGTPVTEDFMPRSTEPYGVSKIACEVLATRYRDMYDFDSIAIRPPITYGLGRLDGGTGLFNEMFRRIAMGEPGELIGTKSLHQPMYHRDMADLFIASLFAPRPEHHIFNTPTYANYTDAEFIADIRKVVPDAQVNVVEPPHFFAIVAVMDGSRAERELGFKARYSIEDGAREMIALYRAKALA